MAKKEKKASAMASPFLPAIQDEQETLANRSLALMRGTLFAGSRFPHIRCILTSVQPARIRFLGGSLITIYVFPVFSFVHGASAEAIDLLCQRFRVVEESRFKEYTETPLAFRVRSAERSLYALSGYRGDHLAYTKAYSELSSLLPARERDACVCVCTGLVRSVFAAFQAAKARIRLHKGKDALFLSSGERASVEHSFAKPSTSFAKAFASVSPYAQDLVRLTSKAFERELRDYQQHGVALLTSHTNGIFDLATNAGKTAILGASVLDTALRTACARSSVIVLAYRSLLANQLLSVLRAAWSDAFPSLPANACVNLYGKGDPRTTVVWIALPKTLLNAVNAGLAPSVHTLLVDECHHAASPTYASLLTRLAYLRVYGFSGTPQLRSDPRNALVPALLGPVRLKITNAALMERSVSALANVVLCKYAYNPVPAGCRRFDSVYRYGIVRNQKRNACILSVVCEHALQDEAKVFVTVKQIEHGQTLYNALVSELGSHAVRFACGKQDRERNEKAMRDFERDGACRVLVGSEVLGEGIDFDARITALVLADGYKAPIGLLQRIGRGLRKGGRSVTVFDFQDNAHVWLSRHSERRKEVYSVQGFPCTLRSFVEDRKASEVRLPPMTSTWRRKK